MRMEKLLLTIVAATGLCVISSHVDRQYHIIYDKKSWAEAVKYCRDHRTDLATIDNMEDMKTLTEMVDLNKAEAQLKSGYTLLWIGLYNGVDSWKWSLSDPDFYKPGELDFRRWVSGQPDGGVQRFAVMDHDGEWADGFPEITHTSVCAHVQGLDVTFHLVNELKTWTEAQSFCRSKYTDLASVRNSEENEKVRQLVPENDWAWIGLFRDSWEWRDGSRSSFRFWADGQPSSSTEECAAADFDNNGKWFSDSCHSQRAFICYIQPGVKNVIQLRVKKDSDVNLDDEAVMEEMRKQIQQKLLDQELGGDLKVSWRKQPDGKVFHKEEEEEEEEEDKGGGDEL